MAEIDVAEVAHELRSGITAVIRMLRTERVSGDLTAPESSALARLERGGSATAADLARAEQISPQSMGSTLAALEEHGLIARRPDPEDGRRVLLSITPSGKAAMRNKRSARTAQLAAALDGFSTAELKQLRAVAPLLERLAENLRGTGSR